MTYNAATSTTPNMNLPQNTNICKIIDQSMLSPPSNEVEEYVSSFENHD